MGGSSNTNWVGNCTKQKQKRGFQHKSLRTQKAFIPSRRWERQFDKKKKDGGIKKLEKDLLIAQCKEGKLPPPQHWFLHKWPL